MKTVMEVWIFNQLYTAYADGYTIVINEIEHFWDTIKLFPKKMKSFMKAFRF
jgi:hypothetical protein